MTKRFGFTLAEVLITLGIIGVVAAMTIPTLISNTSGAQFKTAYKKVLSTMNQAVLMNLAIADTDLSTLKEDTDADGKAAGTLGAILTTRTNGVNAEKEYTASDVIAPTLKVGSGESAAAPTLKFVVACTSSDGKNYTVPETPTDATAPESGATCDADHNAEFTKPMSTTLADYVKFSFADNTAFWYHKGAKNCTKATAVANNCYGYIDANVAKGPNAVINCKDSANGNCNADEITDLYPVIFHGQTVEPATDSARAVLFGK